MPLRLIIRRDRIPVGEPSGDPRSRHRRTVPKDQLTLALDGRVEYVYRYSFIATDLDGDAAEVELWHRQPGQWRLSKKRRQPCLGSDVPRACWSS